VADEYDGPDHDAVMQEVADNVETLGKGLDDGTYGALDELSDTRLNGWIAQVNAQYTRHCESIAEYRMRLEEEKVSAERNADSAQAELAYRRTLLERARARLSGDVHAAVIRVGADAGQQSDSVQAAQDAEDNRDADPGLLAGQSKAYVIGAGTFIAIGAATDTIAFRNTLEIVLQTISEPLAWLMAGGATSMALVSAASLGIGLSIRRRRARRAIFAITSTLSVWLALGLSMFLLRWLDDGSGVQAFGQASGTQGTPLVAGFFGAIYLVSGACTIFEAERFYNPAYFSYRKAREQYKRQVEIEREAATALARAKAALANADDEFKREDQRRDAALAERRALGEEAKVWARFLMSARLQDPEQTYVPRKAAPVLAGPEPESDDGDD
jgi:hypothetical protein